MASMRNSDSRRSEEAAVAVIGRVVDVASKRRSDSGERKAPTGAWR